MQLDAAECWRLLRVAEHGVLATLHPERGVDLVPVVFVIDGSTIVLPIDIIKPKSTLRLQRLENIAADPRVALLVEHYADDWTELWWVRVNGRASESPITKESNEAFGAKYEHYRAEGAIASVMRVTVDSISGWSAAG